MPIEVKDLSTHFNDGISPLACESVALEICPIDSTSTGEGITSASHDCQALPLLEYSAQTDIASFNQAPIYDAVNLVKFTLLTNCHGATSSENQATYSDYRPSSNVVGTDKAAQFFTTDNNDEIAPDLRVSGAVSYLHLEPLLTDVQLTANCELVSTEQEFQDAVSIEIPRRPIKEWKGGTKKTSDGLQTKLPKEGLYLAKHSLHKDDNKSELLTTHLFLHLTDELSLTLDSKTLTWDAAGKPQVKLSFSDRDGSETLRRRLDRMHPCLVSRLAVFHQESFKLDFDIESMTARVSLTTYLQTGFHLDSLAMTLLDQKSDPTFFHSIYYAADTAEILAEPIFVDFATDEDALLQMVMAIDGFEIQKTSELQLKIIGPSSFVEEAADQILVFELVSMPGEQVPGLSCLFQVGDRLPVKSVAMQQSVLVDSSTQDQAFFSSYVCPVPASLSRFVASTDSDDVFVAVSIIDETSWQTYYSVELPLLQPLEYLQVDWVQATCESLVFSDTGVDFDCYLDSVGKRHNLSRIGQLFQLGQEEVNQLASGAQLLCGYESNKFQVAKEMAREDLELLNLCETAKHLFEQTYGAEVTELRPSFHTSGADGETRRIEVASDVFFQATVVLKQSEVDTILVPQYQAAIVLTTHSQTLFFFKAEYSTADHTPILAHTKQHISVAVTVAQVQGQCTYLLDGDLLCDFTELKRADLESNTCIIAIGDSVQDTTFSLEEAKEGHHAGAIAVTSFSPATIYFVAKDLAQPVETSFTMQLSASTKAVPKYCQVILPWATEFKLDAVTYESDNSYVCSIGITTRSTESLVKPIEAAEVRYFDAFGKLVAANTITLQVIPLVRSMEPTYYIMDQEDSEFRITFASDIHDFLNSSSFQACISSGEKDNCHTLIPATQQTEGPRTAVFSVKAFPPILYTKSASVFLKTEHGQVFETGLSLQIHETALLSLGSYTQPFLVQGGRESAQILIDVTSNNLLGDQPLSIDVVRLSNEADKPTLIVNARVQDPAHIAFDLPAGLQSGDYLLKVRQGYQRQSQSMEGALMKVIRTVNHAGPLKSLEWDFSGEIESTIEANLDDLEFACELRPQSDGYQMMCSTDVSARLVVNTVICSFTMRTDCKESLATMNPGVPQVHLDLYIYATHERDGVDSKVLVAQRSGLTVTKFPRFLGFVAQDSSSQSSQMIIRQASNFKTTFYMEHYNTLVVDQTFCWLELTTTAAAHASYIRSQVTPQTETSYQCSFSREQTSQIKTADLRLGLSNLDQLNLVWTATTAIKVVDSWFFAPHDLLEGTQKESPLLVLSPSTLFVTRRTQTVLASIQWEGEQPVGQLGFDRTLEDLRCDFSDGVKLELLQFQCSFVDSTLTKIAIEVPKSFKTFTHGAFYSLKVTLGDYESARLDTTSPRGLNQEVSSLRILRLPQIDSMEPKYVVVPNQDDQSTTVTIHVNGRNFDGLGINGQVECALVTDNGMVYTYGFVMSGSEVECYLDFSSWQTLQYIESTPFQAKIAFKTIETQINVAPHYTRGSNSLQVMSKLYLIGSTLNRVTILPTSFEEPAVGTFRVTVRNNQDFIRQAMSIENDSEEIECVFRRNQALQPYYVTQVLTYAVLSAAVTELECELPIIQDGHPTDSLTLHVRLSQRPRPERPTYEIYSANSLDLVLVPLPVVISIEPQDVFNIMEFRQVSVQGSNFAKSQSSTMDDLLCIFTVQNRQVRTPAVYVSETSLTCDTAEALKAKRAGLLHSIQIQVSNDSGKTLSESTVKVTFRRDLPRLTRVVRPEIIFADEEVVDLTIQGKNFFEGMVLTATASQDTIITSSLVETSAFCNITSTQLAQCFGLVFKVSGSYKLGFSLDHRDGGKKVGSANVRITVVEPVIVKELLVDTGDKSSAEEDELKAIFRVSGLTDFANKYTDIPILCQAYSDAAVSVYEVQVEVIDIASGLVACPARCSSIETTSLDFKLIVNVDKSKRLVQVGLASTTFKCVEPPSDLELSERTPRIVYIDQELGQTGHGGNKNYIELQGRHIQWSYSQEPTCWYTPGASGGKQDITLHAKGVVLVDSYSKENSLNTVRCEIPMKRIGTYTVSYSQGSQVYSGLTGSDLPKYAVSDLVIEILERPTILHLQQQLLKPFESQILMQAHGGLTPNLIYSCLIDNKQVKAEVDFATKLISCNMPVFPGESHCHTVHLIDTYRRQFHYEDPRSTEATICQVVSLETTGEILPHPRLPANGDQHDTLTLHLTPESSQVVEEVSFLINSVGLVLGGIDETTQFLCVIQAAQVDCSFPGAAITLTKEEHFHLSLRLTGLKGESLLYSLSLWLSLHPAIVVRGHQTSESGLVFQGVDTSVTVLAENLLLSETECLYIDSRTEEIFARQLGQVAATGDRIRCPLSEAIYDRKTEFVLHLSGNNGLDVELNPDGIDMTFTVVHSPVLNSIAIPQGFARLANSSTLVIGRGESRTLSLKGTYMNSALGRSPECLFTAYRKMGSLSGTPQEEQWLETQYRTEAAVYSDNLITCETPSELHNGDTVQLHSHKLKLSLLLGDNSQEYRPLNDHKTLLLVTWPILRTIKVKEELQLATKDLRLPQIESLSEVRSVLLDIDYGSTSDSIHEYTVEVDLQCDQIAYSLRKPILSSAFQLTLAELASIQDLAIAAGTSQVSCTVSLQEGDRSESFELPQTHSIVFLAELADFQIDSVDKPRLLIGPWMAQIELTLSNASLEQVQANFKQIKCLLTFTDQLSQTQHIVSTSEVLYLNDQVKCYFTEEMVHQATYCIEILFGGSLQTETCSQVIQVQHVPMTWSTIESQDIETTDYMFDTLIRGSNLDSTRTPDTKWLCYYFFYELETASLKFDPESPRSTELFRVDYSRAASAVVEGDTVACQLSDALEFYSQTHFARTVGLTDLHSHFIDRSIYLESQYQMDTRSDKGVFILGHLVDFEEPGQSDQLEQDLFLFHPGDTVTITGYFLNSASEGASVHLKLATASSDEDLSALSDQCHEVKATRISCRIPADHDSFFGYFTVSLVEIDSNDNDFTLTDSVQLQAVLLPQPSLTVTNVQQTYLTARTDLGDGTIEAVDFKISVSFAPDLADVFADEDIAYLFTDQTLCKLESPTTTFNLVVKGQLTWAPPTIECQFTDNLYIQNEVACVEISLNNGKTYSQGCSATLATERIPLIKNDSFVPLNSHVQDVVWLDFAGERFNTERDYVCSFKHENQVVAKTTLEIVGQSVGLVEWDVRCQTPDPSTYLTDSNKSHLLTISVYHSQSGLRVHTFSTQFTYFAYLELYEVYPQLVSENGDTPLTITVGNLLTDTTLYESPLTCRFSLTYYPDDDDGAQAGEIVYIAATIIDDTSVTCLSPDLSGLQLFSESDAEEYVKCFVSLSEIDGQFKVDRHQHFYVIEHTSLLSITPDFGYESQQQLFTLKLTSVLPEPTLLVRLRTFGTADKVPYTAYQWRYPETIFYVDRETLVYQSPQMQKVDLTDNRVLLVQVSLNDGVTWTSEEILYTTIPPPQITSLSHYWSNLRADFTLTIYGFRFEDNIDLCIFGAEFTSPATFIDSVTVQCRVPAMQEPLVASVALLTDFGYIIDQRAFQFEFIDELSFISIDPTKGSLEGNYQFTLQGNFQHALDRGITSLSLGTVDITDRILLQTSNTIVGTIPPSETTGRREITMVVDQITYWNATIHFTYMNLPAIENCWPYSGQSSMETMLTIYGTYFDMDTKCVFGEDREFEITPVLVTSSHIICPMPQHHATEVTPIYLNLWGDIKQIDSGCTYFYYNDVVIDYLGPDHVSIYAHDNGVVMEVGGFYFREDDKAGNSLQVRIDEQILPDWPEFVGDNLLIIKPRNHPSEGPQSVYVSNNHGISWQRSSSFIQLKYHFPPQVSFVDIAKLQIPTTPTDSDLIQIDLTFTGEYFPEPAATHPEDSHDTTTFYCIWGSNTTVPLYETVWPAERISSQQVKCVDVPLYDSELLPDSTYIDVKFSYNLQEYWGHTRLLYYPKLTIEDLHRHNFSHTQTRLVVGLEGTKFMNTPNITCMLENTELEHYEVHISDHIFFQDPQNLQCTFDSQTEIHAGQYRVSLSNNGVQFAAYDKQLIDVRQAVWIRDISPKLVLTRGSTVSTQHKIIVYAEHLREGDQCYFRVNSTEKAGLIHQGKAWDSLHDDGTLLNSTHIQCQLNTDLTRLGELALIVSIGYENDPKTASQSVISLRITDKCPDGYYCEDLELHECPIGHYCAGGGYLQMARPCPIGFWQPKKASRECMPCIKGTFCEELGMPEGTQCTPGFVCDTQKLTSPRAQCTPGHYCPTGVMGNLPYENGLYDNQTYHCDVGLYCEGGQIDNIADNSPDDLGASVTECNPGMVCHQGSLLTNGVGECPAGYYCPNRNHTGIPCPPRHYCPGRGNIEPLKCLKGTYNMNYGQQNCTACPLSRHCPQEGLYIPIGCPRGYMCNQEGITTPSQLCKIGTICLGDVSTALTKQERSCSILETVGTEFPCDYGTIYSNDTSYRGWPSNSLPMYFNYEGACCNNGAWMARWIREIGEVLGQKELFQVYAEQLETKHEKQYDKNGNQITAPQQDGMDIISWHLRGYPPGRSEGIKVIDPKHSSVINTFIRQMYTDDGPMICPGGRLCLEGVYSTEVTDYYITTPFYCPTGSYCLKGASTVIGSGLCPIGFFCPEKTELPFATPPGSYSGNYGATNYTLCSPGTFQLEFQQDSCDLCPAGYQCDTRGIDMPTICAIGNYRSVIKANRCLQCPKGTFSYERGVQDYLGCFECPAGRTCEEEGLRNVTMTGPCTDGQVCFSGTGAREQIPCPQGYYCPEQTSDSTMYANQCMGGFFCRTGTGEASKTRDNCPQTYYCPPGTGVYDYQSNYADYSNWRGDAPTRCPQGTGLDGSDTKTRILDCFINDEYKMQVPQVSIRLNFDDEWVAEQARLAAELLELEIAKKKAAREAEADGRMLRRLVADKKSPTRALRSIELDPNVLHATKKKPIDRDNIRRLKRESVINDRRQLSSSPRRQLQGGEEAASMDDPRLQDLVEIEFEIKQSKNRLNPVSPIRGFINVERKSIMRINPLNISLIDEWETIEELDPETAKNNMPAVIFKLEPNELMLITMDLRQLMETEFNWVYGEDWAISITIEKELSLSDQENPSFLPEQFLRPKTIKNDIIEIQLYAWDTIRIRIEVLIYNSLYMNHKYAFLNSTSVDIRAPNRAVFGTKNIFIAILIEEHFITLPFNQPPSQPTGLDYPLYISSYAKNYFEFDPVIHQTIKNRNLWIPSSLYWNQRPYLNMPYLPYFSNCQGYGDYVPIWALIEQNSECTIVDRDETIFMTEFSFGGSPDSDSCDEIIIKCAYDEIPSETAALPRWFEVEGGTPLFSLVVEPVDYEDMMTREFDELEVIEVGPENGGGDEGYLPMNIILHLSYFQKGLDNKILIVVEMDFDTVEEVQEPQFLGIEPVYYNFTFTFESFTHKDLTIKFAFEAYFYIVLYIIMGVLSIVVMGIFACFHRAVARPPRSEGDDAKVAPFRLTSYFLLTVPHAFYGVMYAVIPVFIVDSFNAIVITGRVLEYDFSVFDCDNSKREECILTIFDLMKDDADKISVNYNDLRTGRCGVGLFVTGAYLLYIGLTVMIPDISDKRRIHESYDGNIWEYYTWKRSNMIFSSIWIIFLCLVEINFSFSDLFGDYIWYMIIFLKVFSILIDWMLEKAMDQALLLGPLSIAQGVIVGLVTFGADDFLDFIDAYFIEFAMMLFERTYMGNLASSFFEYVEQDIPAKIANIRKWLTSEINPDDEWGTKMDSDSGDSNVNFSDNSSFVKENGQNDDSLVKVAGDVLFNDEGVQSSHSSAQLSDKFRQHDRKQLSDDGTLGNLSLGSYGKENASYDISTDQKSSVQEDIEEEEPESVIEDELIEAEVEPILGEFQGYSNDNISLFYSVFFVALLWVFYEETVVAKEYGIKQSDFIFYLYFQIVIVPFQICVDIIQLNLTEWYHHLPMHDYLDFLNFRFSQRKALWKGNEGSKNTAIDPNLQSIDQLCYSSQHYFVTTIFVAGLAQVIIGMQTLIWVPDYSCYSDQASIPVAMLTFLLCVLTHKLCIFCGKCCKIWHIDEVIEKVSGSQDAGDDFIYLVNKIHRLQTEDDRMIQEEIPDHLRFMSKNWLNLDRVRTKDLQMKADLRTDRVIAEDFKELFLTYNKPWLRQNIHEVFTPRTLFEHKGTIVEEFQKILGPLDPEISTDQEGAKDPKTVFDTTMADKTKNEDDTETPLDTSEREALEEQGDIDAGMNHKVIRERLKQEKERERVEYIDHVQRANPSAKLVAKYWLLRVRFLRKIRVMVSIYIRSQLETECQFCGNQYGLHVELMENLEDIFFAYLEKTGEKLQNFNYLKWLNYFKYNTTYRTSCQDCYDQLLEHYQLERKHVRRQEKIADRKNREQEEFGKISKQEREQWMNHILERSDRSRAVIRFWLATTRQSLVDQGLVIVPEVRSQLPLPPSETPAGLPNQASSASKGQKSSSDGTKTKES